MEGEEVPYTWTSNEPLVEGETEPVSAPFVKAAGKAKVTYPNGDTFEGSFNEAKQKHGKGTYTWSTQPGANPWVPEEGYPEGKEPIVRYEGPYVENVRQGIGKMSFPNGDRYHGQWKKDKFHGQGTYYYNNGDIYSGSWVNGVKEGSGSFLKKNDDSELVGTWEKGSIVSGKWVWRDGTIWQGPFQDNKPLGSGIFFFPNGLSQEGEYVQEGDAEDPDAELKTVWKGVAVR